jgi:hypothetical protein
MLQDEANIAAYQDVFLVSACISLLTIVPGMLRKSQKRAPAESPAPQTVTVEERAIRLR